MNEKLFHLIKNFLLSIAIGSIFFVYHGNSNKEVRYFWWLDGTQKKEVSKAWYNEYSKENPTKYLKVETFVYRNALPKGFISFGYSFLILSGLTLLYNSKFNPLNKIRRRNI